MTRCYIVEAFCVPMNACDILSAESNALLSLKLINLGKTLLTGEETKLYWFVTKPDTPNYACIPITFFWDVHLVYQVNKSAFCCHKETNYKYTISFDHYSPHLNLQWKVFLSFIDIYAFCPMPSAGIFVLVSLSTRSYRFSFQVAWEWVRDILYAYCCMHKFCIYIYTRM